MPKSSPFRDLSEFLDNNLVLPIKGVEYVIPPLSAKDGLWAQSIMDATIRAAVEMDARSRGVDVDSPPAPQTRVLDDDEERDFIRTMLSEPVLQQMIDDKVDWPSISRAAQTAYLYFTVSEEAALARWEDKAGKALSRADRRRKGPSRKKAGRSGTKMSQPPRQRTT